MTNSNIPARDSLRRIPCDVYDEPVYSEIGAELTAALLLNLSGEPPWGYHVTYSTYRQRGT